MFCYFEQPFAFCRLEPEFYYLLFDASLKQLACNRWSFPLPWIDAFLVFGLQSWTQQSLKIEEWNDEKLRLLASCFDLLLKVPLLKNMNLCFIVPTGVYYESSSRMNVSTCVHMCRVWVHQNPNIFQNLNRMRKAILLVASAVVKSY